MYVLKKIDILPDSSLYSWLQSLIIIIILDTYRLNISNYLNISGRKLFLQKGQIEI